MPDQEEQKGGDVGLGGHTQPKNLSWPQGLQHMEQARQECLTEGQTLVADLGGRHWWHGPGGSPMMVSLPPKINCNLSGG